MDREFMKSFLQNYYTDYQSEAVKDSAEYQESKKRRYEMEFLLQEVYLQGAQDREKMLRGII